MSDAARERWALASPITVPIMPVRRPPINDNLWDVDIMLTILIPTAYYFVRPSLPPFFHIHICSRSFGRVVETRVLTQAAQKGTHTTLAAFVRFNKRQESDVFIAKVHGLSIADLPSAKLALFPLHAGAASAAAPPTARDFGTVGSTVTPAAVSTVELQPSPTVGPQGSKTVKPAQDASVPDDINTSSGVVGKDEAEVEGSSVKASQGLESSGDLPAAVKSATTSTAAGPATAPASINTTTEKPIDPADRSGWGSPLADQAGPAAAAAAGGSVSGTAAAGDHDGERKTWSLCARYATDTRTRWKESCGAWITNSSQSRRQLSGSRNHSSSALSRNSGDNPSYLNGGGRSTGQLQLASPTSTSGPAGSTTTGITPRPGQPDGHATPSYSYGGYGVAGGQGGSGSGLPRTNSGASRGNVKFAGVDARSGAGGGGSDARIGFSARRNGDIAPITTSNNNNGGSTTAGYRKPSTASWEQGSATSQARDRDNSHSSGRPRLDEPRAAIRGGDTEHGQVKKAAAGASDDEWMREPGRESRASRDGFTKGPDGGNGYSAAVYHGSGPYEYPPGGSHQYQYQAGHPLPQPQQQGQAGWYGHPPAPAGYHYAQAGGYAAPGFPAATYPGGGGGQFYGAGGYWPAAAGGGVAMGGYYGGYAPQPKQHQGPESAQPQPYGPGRGSRGGDAADGIGSGGRDEGGYDHRDRSRDAKYPGRGNSTRHGGAVDEVDDRRRFGIADSRRRDDGVDSSRDRSANEGRPAEVHGRDSSYYSNFNNNANQSGDRWATTTSSKRSDGNGTAHSGDVRKGVATGHVHAYGAGSTSGREGGGGRPVKDANVHQQQQQQPVADGGDQEATRNGRPHNYHPGGGSGHKEDVRRRGFDGDRRNNGRGKGRVSGGGGTRDNTRAQLGSGDHRSDQTHVSAALSPSTHEWHPMAGPAETNAGNDNGTIVVGPGAGIRQHQQQQHPQAWVDMHFASGNNNMNQQQQQQAAAAAQWSSVPAAASAMHHIPGLGVGVGMGGAMMYAGQNQQQHQHHQQLLQVVQPGLGSVQAAGSPYGHPSVAAVAAQWQMHTMQQQMQQMQPFYYYAQAPAPGPAPAGFIYATAAPADAASAPALPVAAAAEGGH